MSRIDNSWYDGLHDAWWDPGGPVRALHEVNPVSLDYFLGVLGDLRGRRVLDLGCGGGLMTETYARAGAIAVGLELSLPSLRAARRHARTAPDGTPRYVGARAESLPFGDATFDVVCTADSLEHVDDLPTVLDESSRVLRPGGLFIFDTINRTWRSRVMMIWAAQHVLRFAPQRTHVFERFIRPKELRASLNARGLGWRELRGLSLRRHPAIAAWLYVTSGRLGGFTLSKDTRVSYVGYARKDPAGRGGASGSAST